MSELHFLVVEPYLFSSRMTLPQWWNLFFNSARGTLTQWWNLFYNRAQGTLYSPWTLFCVLLLKASWPQSWAWQPLGFYWPRTRHSASQQEQEPGGADLCCRHSRHCTSLNTPPNHQPWAPVMAWSREQAPVQNMEPHPSFIIDINLLSLVSCSWSSS